jgi:transposase
MGRSGRAPAPPAIEAGQGAKDKTTPSQNHNSAIAFIGIDIGKNSFHLVGLDAIAMRQKWSRGQVEARLANMPPCLIGMEACDAGQIVRPHSKGQKNDFRDAEAMQRPTMKFVTTKTAKQLNLQALHVCASD